MNPKLVTYSGTTIPIGDIAELDDNFPVTVTNIRPPCDDKDPGDVTVRFEWGTTETVDPARLGAYIDS